MIPLDRIANNALTLLVLGGFGWLIWQGMQNNQSEAMEKIKGWFKKDKK